MKIKDITEARRKGVGPYLSSKVDQIGRLQGRKPTPPVKASSNDEDYDCRCYEIGGPWIDVDPNCPIHGHGNES